MKLINSSIVITIVTNLRKRDEVSCGRVDHRRSGAGELDTGVGTYPGGRQVYARIISPAGLMDEEPGDSKLNGSTGPLVAGS